MKIMHEINDVINLLITYMFDMLTGSVSNKFLVLQKKKYQKFCNILKK